MGILAALPQQCCHAAQRRELCALEWPRTDNAGTEHRYLLIRLHPMGSLSFTVGLLCCPDAEENQFVEPGGQHTTQP